MGHIFALVVVRDYGNTTNGKMKNRKCGQSLKSSSNLTVSKSFLFQYKCIEIEMIWHYNKENRWK